MQWRPPWPDERSNGNGARELRSPVRRPFTSAGASCWSSTPRAKPACRGWRNRPEPRARCVAAIAGKRAAPFHKSSKDLVEPLMTRKVEDKLEFRLQPALLSDQSSVCNPSHLSDAC